MIKLVTEREKIRTVAERWDHLYHAPDFSTDFAGSVSSILHLLDLERANAEHVNTIIGNDHWTKIECTECSREVKSAIHVGDDNPDSNDLPAVLCAACIMKAVVLINGGSRV